MDPLEQHRLAVPAFDPGHAGLEERRGKPHPGGQQHRRDAPGGRGRQPVDEAAPNSQITAGWPARPPALPSAREDVEMPLMSLNS